MTELFRHTRLYFERLQSLQKIEVVDEIGRR